MQNKFTEVIPILKEALCLYKLTALDFFLIKYKIYQELNKIEPIELDAKMYLLEKIEKIRPILLDDEKSNDLSENYIIHDSMTLALKSDYVIL